MSTPVPASPTTALAIQPGQASFTQTQVAALAQLGLDKANDADLAVFFHTCVRVGLDPFRKQIYMIGRYDRNGGKTKYTIQTGIDGYRLIAERTGRYVGSDETWTNDANGKPLAATVTVKKLVNGQPYDFTATAHIDEYCQTGKEGKPIGLWAKMPHRMLAKCAEALALRKAFPEDLSGIYTDEEMSQAETQPTNTITVTSTHVATPEQTPAGLDDNPYQWTYDEITKAATIEALDAVIRVAKPKLSDQERDALRPIYIGRKAEIEGGDR